jgi:hypothetical protein
LVGTGSTLLALPLLPSLLPSVAQAQAAQSSTRMMNFIFNHHAESAYWPARSIATTSVGTIGVKERLLSGMGSSASTVISPFLSNPLYNTLLAQDQITLARGLTVQLSDGNGHVTRAMGGHTVDECGSTSTNPNHRSTFDYIVEKSPTVYPTSAGLTKSIRIDLGGCWTFVQREGTRSVNPNAYNYDYENTVLTMYNAVFGSLTAGTTSPTDLTNQHKTNILNRVFPAFQSYRNSRKISADDKVRLDQHLGFISDMQNNLKGVTPAFTCSKPSAPVVGTNMAVNGLYVDLVVLAMKCGLTRFATLHFEYQDPTWLPGYTGGSGFHGIMHGDKGLAAQHNAYESLQKFGYNLIADRFLTPLNVQEGNTGRTYADNMITTALSALGMQGPTETGNHNDDDLQHVIFGSMGGKLRAGRYYALPNTNSRYLPHNTFVMTLLNLMGVPASEYSTNSSVAGQGFGYYSSSSSPYGTRIYTPITEMLA